MKKVYFNIRPHSRERMWDTIKYAKELCDTCLADIKQQSSIKSYNKYNTSIISKMKCQISKRLINKQKIDILKSNNADLIYMWGAFPKNTDKKYIIELDNPYSLAYYNIENFNRNKDKIKDYLDKSYKITYLSETCKHHSLELFGKEFVDKSFVIYPYMSDNYKKNKREKDIINFIFVGLNSRGKGGNELLGAFHNIKAKNIRLTFISTVDEQTKIKYQNDRRINILPPQSREILLNKIYPMMDVMIVPSLYESFGVVLLEALSYGLGIITVNVYATGEIVKDNYNGRLLHHPILKPTILNNKQVVNCVDLTIHDFHKRYLENNEFYYGLYLELKLSIEESLDNFKMWQKNSLELFNQKFSPKIWQKNFREIIK